MSITTSIRDNVENAIVEMAATHKERLHIIKGLWVALVAKQHLLMLGPGGTGKSFLVRDLAGRIEGSNYFETALDETSDPGQVFGPVDIKAMKEEGKHRRRSDGMLPEADIAFIDEFFNANGPTLHGMMPILNERLFHNNGNPSPSPLWSAFMGTNKLNADTDQAATWDRIHQRYVVKYVQERDHIREMVTDSIARRITSYEEPPKASIKLSDLHIAHDEAMQLEITENAWETFLDIKDELLHEGVVISSRRLAEGMAAVLANTWLNGHDAVAVGDLDILQAMWWSTQAEVDTAQSVILSATNPGEKAALDFMEDLDKFRVDLERAESTDMDDTKKRLVGMEAFKNCKRILGEAEQLKEKANAAGAGTARIQELEERATTLMQRVEKDFFGL